MVWIIIIILLVGADQLLKQLVMQALSGPASITVIENFFYIVHRRNTGAAWSFLADASWGITILSVLSGLASIVLLVLTLRLKKARYKATLALMTAGAVGNLIDRIRFRSVTDFLDFHFGAYIFPTFNVADMCLVIGTILLSWYVLRDPDQIKSTKPANPTQPIA